MAGQERVKEGTKLIPQTLPLIYIKEKRKKKKKKALPGDRHKEATGNLAQTSPVLCNSTRAHTRTHTHTHTHTLTRPESTSPFNLVDIVLHLFPSLPQTRLDWQQGDRCNLTAKRLAGTQEDTQDPETRLIALRGAEITPARKSKGASALDLPGLGAGGRGAGGASCEENS